MGSTKKGERINTFPGKLVVNVVQAISRDLLCHAMQQLEAVRRPIVNIRDEVVIDAPKDNVDEVGRSMGIVPLWAEGLILDAAGYETGFYMKD